MSQKPLVSIITPSYNQGQFIRETIESVLNQKYPNLEYLVMDGGSTDDTVKILKEYGKKLQWVSEKDNGQTDAINKGLKQSKGEILMYINSDDVMLPGTIERVVQLFEQNPKAHWLTGDYRIIDEHGKSREGFIVVYKRLQRWVMSLGTMWQVFFLSINNPIAQPSTWWRREALKKTGYFHEELHYTMDYDYWWRLLRLGPALMVFEPFSAFRVHSLSKGGMSYGKQMAQQLEVARLQGVNQILLSLHALHNRLIILIYRFLR